MRAKTAPAPKNFFSKGLRFTNKGLTLIELLVVISIIAVITVTGVISFANIKARQALTSSAENVASNFKRAKIFARESKDDKEWGIRYVNSSTYSMWSRDISGTTQAGSYTLESPAQFGSNFGEIWFNKGLGTTAGSASIVIRTSPTKQMTVNISQSGIVEVGP